jgi:predicted nuclease of predicted toxin-antitoxin system
MIWRFLIDEDTDIAAASALRTHGYDAVAIEEAMNKGTQDADVRTHAAETDRILVTTDRDFLDPERNRGIAILLVPSAQLPGEEVARRVLEVIEHADEPDALGRVVWLSDG